MKTYPIPSAKYDELVCTAGVTETGEFIRLYPIRFRDLPYSQQYKKYQWIEVQAEKHKGRDTRKESYRAKEDSLRILGEPISTKGTGWAERAKFALERLHLKSSAVRRMVGLRFAGGSCNFWFSTCGCAAQEATDGITVLAGSEGPGFGGVRSRHADQAGGVGI